MKNEDKAQALKELVQAGTVGSAVRKYTFETPISKLLGNQKYDISQTVPIARNAKESEMIAQALGKSTQSLLNRAFDIEIRMVFVEIEKESRVKIEAEKIKALTASTETESTE